MKKLNAFLLIVALLFGITPVNVSAMKKETSAETSVGGARNKSAYKLKRNKKAVHNYTHTTPADGAKAWTRSTAKKFKKINSLALKNSFQKWTARKN